MTRIYNITMKTPFGIKQGKITLVISNGSLSGVLEGMGSRSEFYNGQINGDNFEFSGEAKNIMARIQYTVRGTLNNNMLQASVNTNYGQFDVTGILISQS